MKKAFSIITALALWFSMAGNVFAAAYNYYYPYYVYAVGEGSATGLGLRNLNRYDRANVKVTVYNEYGNKASFLDIDIDARGQWSDVVGDAQDREGWIHVESDQPLAGLAFAAMKGLMMDIPETDILAREMVIPHGAQSNYWDNVIYVANPNGSRATAIFRLVKTNGSLYGTYNATIPAKGSVQIPLADKIGGGEFTGGSIEIESQQGLAAFALYHNLLKGGSQFAGINAKITSVGAFDGNWSGTLTPTTPHDDEGDPCENAEINFEVSEDKIEGTGRSNDGSTPGALEGLVTPDGDVMISVFIYGTPVGVLQGQVSENTAGGEWYHFWGCYGTWTATK